MEPFIGQIQAFGFDFAPQGWLKCDGAELPIAQYSPLYSLLGTAYGGDGRTSFRLPDLRGRVAIHQGQAPGLSNHIIGQYGGTESVALNQAEMPAHNHAVHCVTTAGNAQTPAGAYPASENVPTADIWSSSNPDAQMSPNMIAGSGEGMAHTNMQPYAVVNWCIAVEGLYPTRS